MSREIEKTDEQWRAQLTPEEFEVTRRQATERPFTGKYWNHNEAGQYHCICCGELLFDSATKFDAGCGWPSFSDAAKPGAIDTNVDRSHGMVREEIVCHKCGAHVGHIFPDGPAPTGQRYCVNSASINFEKKK